MRLAALQQLVQEHVLDGGELPDSLAAAVAPPAADRWRIYTDGYRLRLIEALLSQYPACAAFVGETRFNALAAAFVEATPSVHRSIRDYGSEFAAFLGGDGSSVEALVLADLAAFEWQLEASFDAAPATPTTVTDLANVAPADWPGLRFQAVPSLGRIRTRSNAVALWRQLNPAAPDGPPRSVAAIPDAVRSDPVEWLVTRRELTTEYRSLDAAEAAALDGLIAGATFGALCESLAAPFGDAAAMQAASWLKGWLIGGLLVRV
jgi:hypothetical protein